MLATSETFQEFMEEHFKYKVRRFIFSESFEIKEEFNKFRDYLQTRLPTSIKDKLMNDMLLSYSGKCYESETIKRILKIFLSKKTQELKIFQFRDNYETKPFSYLECFFRRYFIRSPSNDFSGMIQVINHFQANLIHLELFIEYLSFSDLKSILRYTPNLKSLKFRSSQLGMYDFLGLISNSCSGLEKLLLIGENINFNSVHRWLPHENLKILTFRLIGMNIPTIHNSNLNKILENFPNLEHLFIALNCPDELTFTSKIAKHLKEFRLNISSLHNIELIHHNFPKINTLFIVSPDIGVVNFIPNFKHLKIIEIWDIEPADLTRLVSIIGSQFTRMHLGVAEVNLTVLLESCPNLELLDLNWRMSLAETFRLNRIDMIQVEDRDIIHKKLRKFHFSCNPKFNPKRFLLRLKSVPIEILSFNNLIINDTDLEDLLPAWKNLKILLIPHARNISLIGVKRILKLCNKLQKILIPSHLNASDIELRLNSRNIDLNLLDSEYNRFHFLIDIEHGKFDPFLMGAPIFL